ncbi:NLI interacting factor-like phosphatase-domain-containing protein [Pavlovales sp. CCMP2436]|nr:NLI interacting factor-like phosphatase-domain-containing protein [Pavlovales sp. CCMP2436]
MSAFDSAKQAVHDNLVAPFTEASQEHLLPGLPSRLKGKELPTLVIALDDVILHSTWDRQYGWRYMKRPGVDEFLRALSPYYEIVVWTEQFSLMEPVISSLDKHQVVRHRLYKDGMVYRNGRHVKDLKHLNRQLSKTVVIDCNKRNTSQQPENYLLVTPFTGEAAPEAAAAPAASEDDVLVKHIPFLVNLACLAYVKGVDVREELKRYEGADVPAKFADEVRQIKGGRGTRASATGAVTGTPTVWERMRSSRGSS